LYLRGSKGYFGGSPPDRGMWNSSSEKPERGTWKTSESLKFDTSLVASSRLLVFLLVWFLFFDFPFRLFISSTGFDDSGAAMTSNTPELVDPIGRLYLDETAFKGTSTVLVPVLPIPVDFFFLPVGGKDFPLGGSSFFRDVEFAGGNLLFPGAVMLILDIRIALERVVLVPLALSTETEKSSWSPPQIEPLSPFPHTESSSLEFELEPSVESASALSNASSFITFMPTV
jgi:hypothetical protein